MPAKGSTAEQRFADRMAQRNRAPQRSHNIHTERAEALGRHLTMLLLDHRPAITVPRDVLEQALAVANFVRTRPHVL
jgi:hypothetical protein